MLNNNLKPNLNFQKILENELNDIKIKNRFKRPVLLLHSCCGPCSSYVLNYLKDIFNIKLLFYNPNIHPESEYNLRKKEQLRLLSCVGFENIEFIDSVYNPLEFFSTAKNIFLEKEGGERCSACYKLRLLKAAKIAKEIKADYFTTTLTVSPHKNASKINLIGAEIENTTSSKYLFSDFKKKDGYKKSIEFSKKYNLYRQNYCGCIFSKNKNTKNLNFVL